MSTYILMKVLEYLPRRYDEGIRILTLGKLDSAYDRLASHIEEGQRVLDLGCGTGALTLRAALKGAKVKGIDINPQMLDIVRGKIVEANLASKVEVCEMGVGELGGERRESYDVVMGGLCFSELTEAELAYALEKAKDILKPGGLLLIADEVRPKNMAKLILNWLIRFPLAVVTYFVAQTGTNPLRNLPERMKEAGLVIESAKLSKMESFIELVARKPKEG
jgi:cyclopropane fatty-acyl-phospholipid synthase-like methyltransferase